MGDPIRTATAAALLAAALVGCGTHAPAGFANEPGAGAEGGAPDSPGGGGGTDGSFQSSVDDGGLEGGGPRPSGNCDATCAAAGGVCLASVCTLTENPGSIAPAMQATLQRTGKSDASFAWLYPSDHTVFARGLIAPTLQFGGGASDGEFLHITSTALDYSGYFVGGPQGSRRLAPSQKAWDEMTAAVGANDVVQVAVTQVAGGSVTGHGKLWVAAIDIGAAPGADPSHPPPLARRAKSSRPTTSAVSATSSRRAQRRRIVAPQATSASTIDARGPRRTSRDERVRSGRGAARRRGPHRRHDGRAERTPANLVRHVAPVEVEDRTRNLGELAAHFAPLAGDARDAEAIVGRRLVAHPGDDGGFGPLFHGDSLRSGHGAAR